MNKDKIAAVLTARERDLGGFKVGRVLPAIGRKMVGPFIFFDRMGPAVLAAGQGIDVRPHPHIGLATVTFLFEGAITHRDSLGYEQVIRPGDVNWMTAGAGIVHSERTPAELRLSGSRLDGIQLWVALPDAHEETEPSFHHHPERTLPQFEAPGVGIRLLVGTLLNRESPVHSHSDIVYADLRLSAGAKITLPAGKRELGIFLAQGRVKIGNQALAENALAVGHPGQDLTVTAEAPAHILLLGGEPFPGTREIWWNFVSSSKQRIEKAKADWRQGRFPKVLGDDLEFTPLPEK